MRADFWLLALFGVANGSVLINRQDFDAAGEEPTATDDQSDPNALAAPAAAPSPWKPITKWPKFFSLAIDETQSSFTGGILTADTTCNPLLTPVKPGSPRLVTTAGVGGVAVGDDLTGLFLPCYFSNYAIRLNKGKVIATPYDKWFSPKLPLFIVDDDTKCYTVSKKPYQLYVDRASGQLKYSQVGWLSPDAIATSFFLLGDNPTRDNDPSSAWLSWPSTQGRTPTPWYLCPLGLQQFEVYIANVNFGTTTPGALPVGGAVGDPLVPAPGSPFRVPEDRARCFLVSLAALNASPWQYGGGGYGP